jgi:hypothetical protein
MHRHPPRLNLTRSLWATRRNRTDLHGVSEISSANTFSPVTAVTSDRLSASLRGHDRGPHLVVIDGPYISRWSRFEACPSNVSDSLMNTQPGQKQGQQGQGGNVHNGDQVGVQENQTFARQPKRRRDQIHPPGPDGMLYKMTTRFYDRVYLASAVMVGMAGGIAVVAGVIAFANSLTA